MVQQDRYPHRPRPNSKWEHGKERYQWFSEFRLWELYSLEVLLHVLPIQFEFLCLDELPFKVLECQVEGFVQVVAVACAIEVAVLRPELKLDVDELIAFVGLPMRLDVHEESPGFE